MTPADVGHGYQHLVDSWQRFVDLLGSSGGRALVGTAEAAEALLARSTLERAIETGQPVDREHLAGLDERYRTSAPALLEETRIELYANDEPSGDWWWHVSPLAGQSAEARFFDVATVAARTGAHVNTVRAAIHAGELPARRLGRSFLIHTRDVTAWVPRARGRPSRGAAEDRLLETFNTEMARGPSMRTRDIAAQLADEPTTARRCLAVAIEQYNEGRYEECLDWLERAVQLGLKGDGQAKMSLVRGLALIQLGRAPDAARELSGVRASRDLAWRIQAARGEALLAAGLPSEAEAVVADAVDERPDIGELRYLASRILFHDDRPAEALPHIIEFRRGAPDDGPGLLLHGSILGRLGDVATEDRLYVEANRLFARAMPTEGDRARTKLALGMARLGRWQESLEHAAALGHEVPVHVRDRVVQAALLGYAKRSGISEARVVADYAERHFAPTPMTRVFVALDLGARGRHVQALQVLTRDITSDVPLTPEIDCLVGLAFWTAGDPSRAVARFQRLAFRPESGGVAHVLWASAAAAADEPGQALSALELLGGHDSMLGRLAHLCVSLVEQRDTTLTRERAAAEDLMSFASSWRIASSYVPWDLLHKDVSRVMERTMAKARLA